MKTRTKVFLVFFLLIIAAVIVIGVDVYLSYKDFEAKSSEFVIGTPAFDIASNNESATITSSLSTPSLGYMPKSVRLDITVKKGGSVYGDPQQVTIKLGESQNLEFVLVFEAADITTISTGGTISLTVEVLATPIYFGIPLNFVAQEFAPLVIDIHI
ncbi:MAG: hypothetical protein H7641_03415 [Candidatus Heimdallarchaeota archaeon]|nr:hypothetical protein [Candidatus Heimdallarchaeota archaeon]MCK4876610.1 hypothetical protein [Candidatus Heimdallarchaeota archaeon]